MKNLKISMKLIITFSLVMILMITSSALSILSAGTVNRDVDDLIDGPMAIRNSLDNVATDFEHIIRSIYQAISTTDPATMQAAIEESTKVSEEMNVDIAFIKENFSGSNTTIVDKLIADIGGLAAIQEVLTLAGQGQFDEARASMEQNAVPAVNTARATIDEFDDLLDAEIASSRAHLDADQANSTTITIAVGIASIILTVFFGLMITRSITKPVRQLQTSVEEMASGSLNVTFPYESKDEIGTLSAHMREMSEVLHSYVQDIGRCMSELGNGNLTISTSADFKGDYSSLRTDIDTLISSLNSTMRNISQSSEQVLVEANQVSDGSQALAQGATEQASSVQQLSASINEISNHVKASAENAQQAKGAVGAAGACVNECNGHMSNLSTAMKDINEKSQEISKIIKTIDDIAFQTNILALNAAVEAARAGAAGKGFAVVADEVRNLAAKSAEAANHTTALINSSISAVDRGTKFANDTANSLLEIIENAGKVEVLTDQMAISAQDQAASITQITQGIEQISMVVQANAATSEESAAASEELSGQAHILKNQVSRFVFKQDDFGAPAISGHNGGMRELPSAPGLPEANYLDFSTENLDLTQSQSGDMGKY